MKTEFSQMQLGSLQKKLWRAPLPLSPHEATARRWPSMNQEVGSHQILTELASALDFPASRSERNKCLLSISILLFSSISLHCSFKKAFWSLLVILWNSAFRWVYLSFFPLPFTSLLFSPICKASSAAATKSLQSCPTLCDPIDNSPPGSSVHRIL